MIASISPNGSTDNGIITYLALTEVIIPSSVKSIGSYFCLECINLKNIVFCGSSDFSSLSIAFYNCSKYEKAIVSNDYPKSTFGSKPVEAVDFRN